MCVVCQDGQVAALQVVLYSIKALLASTIIKYLRYSEYQRQNEQEHIELHAKTQQARCLILKQSNDRHVRHV